MKNRFITKEVFLKEFDDLSIFQGERYNYFRIAQSSLFSVFAQRQSKNWNFFRLGIRPLKVYYFLKFFRNKKTPIKNLDAPYFFSAGGRLVNINGQWQSSYLSVLLNQLGRKNCHIHFRVGSINKKTEFDSTTQDLRKNKQKLTQVNLIIYRDLKNVLSRIKEAKNLSLLEKLNIQIGFEAFFKEYVGMDNFLKNFESGTKFFIFPAYQNEAHILAAKQNKFEVIELQHGIIGQDSRFYIYPLHIKSVIKNSLFTDRIFVWGEYWKQRLLEGIEFNSKQIDIIGDFILRKDIGIKDKKNVLLITVNKYMQDLFIPFIEKQASFVKNEHKGWEILLKLHPGDSDNLQYFKKFQNSKIVKISKPDETLEDCISVAKIQAGIFSMAMFETLGHIEACFSIKFGISKELGFDEYTSFQLEMEECNIADLVHCDSDLIGLYLSRKFNTRVERNFVFADFRSARL